MMEIWKKLKTDETYEASNLGNIRHLYRGKYRPIKPYDNGTGYLVFRIGSHKYMSVHRAVAEAFLEEVEGKPFVDHINRNRQDNRVENLRYCTRKENSANTVRGKAIYAGNGKRFREPHPVYCVELKLHFPSYRAAAEYLGVSSSLIVYACKKLTNTGASFHWVREE